MGNKFLWVFLFTVNNIIAQNAHWDAIYKKPADLRDQYSISATIRHSTFGKGPIYLQEKFNPTLSGSRVPVLFDSCIFRESSFSGLSFFKGLNFYDCNFSTGYSLLNGITECSIRSHLYIINSKFTGCFYIRDCKLDSIYILHSRIDNFALMGAVCEKEVNISSDFKTFSFSGCTFTENVDLYNSAFLKLYIDDCSFRRLDIRGDLLCDTLELVNLKNINDEIRIQLYDGNRIEKKQYYINLKGSDIERINFPYHRFNLYFDKYTDLYEKSRIYEAILKKIKLEGLSNEIYKKYDVEYKRLLLADKHFVERYFQKLWDFGYNRGLILTIVVFIFLISCVLNFLFFVTVSDIYEIKNFKHYPYSSKITYLGKIQLLSSNVWISFLYTAMIFLGFKMEYEKLKVHNLIICTYICFLHLSGIIFIFLIINYLIS